MFRKYFLILLITTFYITVKGVNRCAVRFPEDVTRRPAVTRRIGSRRNIDVIVPVYLNLDDGDIIQARCDTNFIRLTIRVLNRRYQIL